MRVFGVERRSAGGGFVEYPITECNRDWDEVTVSLRTAAEEPPCERGLQMRGERLVRAGGWSVYTCGGFLTRCKEDHGECVWISVCPTQGDPTTTRAQ